MDKREFRCKVECRADDSRTSPGRIVGTLIETGRVASDRREVFAPGSIKWPHNGMSLLERHHGQPVMRFQPIEDGAALRIDAPLPDTALGRQVAAEIRSGARSDLSIEFFANDESDVSGVREIRSALVDAVALADSGTRVYEQARAEVRAKAARAVPLWL